MVALTNEIVRVPRVLEDVCSTQRQWSDLAIVWTTPALLGLFSLVALFAQARLDGQPLSHLTTYPLRRTSPCVLSCPRS